MDKRRKLMDALKGLDDAASVVERIESEDDSIQKAVAKAKLPKGLSFQDKKEPLDFAYPASLYLDAEGGDGGDVTIEIDTVSGAVVELVRPKGGKVKVSNDQQLTKAVEKLAKEGLSKLT